jgi:hypothetical protein
VSFGNRIPFGFSASMKWQFEGDIPSKVWKGFRTKFVKEHAPGWQVKKYHTHWGKNGGDVVVTFQATNPDTAREMTGEQWEFLKATISLMAVKEA